MLPLHDDNPTYTAPLVTIGLIVANVLAFFYQWSVVGLSASAWIYGLIPVELTQGVDLAIPGRAAGLPPGVEVRNMDPSWLTIFTSMFMHGGLLHILSNMWFLWLFGNNVEDALGKVKFLLFYLACGVAAAMAQVLTNSSSQIPMVGASGAVAGVLGAYLVLFPGSRVLTLVFLGFIATTMRFPAWIVLGFWFVLEAVRGFVSLGPTAQVGGVAYMAHVGGFAAGWLLIRFLGAHPHRGPSSAERYQEVYQQRGTDSPDWR